MKNPRRKSIVCPYTRPMTPFVIQIEHSEHSREIEQLEIQIEHIKKPCLAEVQIEQRKFKLNNKIYINNG